MPLSSDAYHPMLNGAKYVWNSTASFAEVGNYPTWPAVRLYGGMTPTAEMNREHEKSENWDYVPVNESSFYRCEDRPVGHIVEMLPVD